VNDRDETVLTVIATVATAYPHANFTADTAAVWRELLADIDVPTLKMAVTKLLATHKFCPSIAEVRAAALSTKRTIGEESPEAAWGVVLDAIRRFGWARQPSFTDPVIERALQCTIGWYDLCTSELSDGPSHRARFIAAYESLQAKVREGLLLPQSLRDQLEASRKDHVAGVLEDQYPGRESVSDQARHARALVSGLGDGPRQAP